jgi:hypothetical protein
MRALKIDPNGWVFKLATFGGFPEDGITLDKGIVKQNKLLYSLYLASNMGASEYQSRKKDEYRPANFCEFSRAIVWGIIVGLAIAIMIFSIAFAVIVGTGADIVWLASKLLHGHFYQVTWKEVIGFVVWGMAAFFGACMLAEYWSKQWKLNRKESPEEADELEEKIRKKELRQAFWGAIRNKTCFKVELK